jgi:hypothetical protein
MNALPSVLVLIGKVFLAWAVIIASLTSIGCLLASRKEKRYGDDMRQHLTFLQIQRELVRGDS